MKCFLYKLAFLYPRIYAFFCYYRKVGRRREIENKMQFFCNKGWNSKRMRSIVKGVFELRGSRKAMRRLIPLMDAHFIKRFVKVEGLHYLNYVLEEGRGAILMAGHLGNPHLSYNALRIMGYDVTIVKGGIPRRPKHPRFEYYDHPQNTLFVHDPSLASEDIKGRVLDILRSGKIIYYTGHAAEGRVKGRALFFRREMDFPTAMIHLAHQAKAAIIPFIHLYQKGQILLILKDPIDDHWQDGQGTYIRILEEYARILESYILTYPEQYMGIYGPTVLSAYYKSYKNSQIPLGEG